MAASTITVKMSPTEYANYKRFLKELLDAKLAKSSRKRHDSAVQDIILAISSAGVSDPSEAEAAEILGYLQERKVAVTSPGPAERDSLRKDVGFLGQFLANT